MTMGIRFDNSLMKAPYEGLKGIESVYFIGIGGIGMSALARFFNEQGVSVSGYDKTKTELTLQLEKEGMKIHYTDDLSLIPSKVDWVVFTPAIPASHKELNYFKENGYTILKRSDVLEKITRSSLNIGIAGTHGKTTTTTMVAHLLRHSGVGCNAFLGGISSNYNTNYWSAEQNCCVVEADEFDRSFLKLNPDLALISSMDPDHLDIYGSAQKMEEAFLDFSALVKPGGVLVYKKGLTREKDFRAKQLVSYHLSDTEADCYATNIEVTEGGYAFDIKFFDDKISSLYLPMGGLHNIENAIGAIAIAKLMGLTNEQITKALACFAGVKRRFEIVAKQNGLTVIDDYAHHPQELRALISGVRSVYKNQKCLVVFQPHLYSRTRDLAAEFAAALDDADEVILLPIYPARELPIEGVSSEMILGLMKKEKKAVKSELAVLEWISDIMNLTEKQVIVTAGAGSIDQLPVKINEILKNKSGN